MKMLELFSGSGNMAKAFRENGFENGFWKDIVVIVVLGGLSMTAMLFLIYSVGDWV